MKITGVSARPVALEQNEALRTSGGRKKECGYHSKSTLTKGCATKEVVQQSVQLPPPSSSSSSGGAPIQTQVAQKGCVVQEQIQAPACEAQQGEVVQQGHKGFFHRFKK